MNDDQATEWAKALARTDEMCNSDPLLGNTREQLLEIELDGHRAGWDNPETSYSRIFQLDSHPDTLQVVHGWCNGYTGVLARAAQEYDGNIGRAFVDVGEFMEEVAGFYRHGTMPASLVGQVTPEFLESIMGGFGLAGVEPHEDIGGAREDRPGFRLLGVGVRSEAWGVLGGGEDVEKASREHRLYQHPDRIESRVINFADRTGRHWYIARQRDRMPEVRVFSLEPDSHSIAGGVAHGLSRVVNALVAEDTHIWPADPSS